MAMDEIAKTHPIVLDGLLVALAGPTRCYLLANDLTEVELEIVGAMCLCSREVRSGRLDGPFTTEVALRWARIYASLAG